MSDVILGIDPGTNLMGYGVLRVAGRSVEVVQLGVIDMRKLGDGYEKLGYIHQKMSEVLALYRPTQLAIEAPFFGKNVQSMLKLGRAQGVAIAAAIAQGVEIHEYAPLKVKMALTGRGSASKAQVADMLQRILRLDVEQMSHQMDATDALAVAYCHYMQQSRPASQVSYKSWKDYAKKKKLIE